MLLVVPGPDAEPWPTIGPQVCQFIEDRGVYGPGSLQGQPYRIDPEFRAFLYRGFEVYPRIVTKAFAGGGPGLILHDPHPWAGRRRFKRVGLSVRKGLAKTEKQALVVYSHIHPEGPGRCDGFDAHGQPVAAPVRAPYVPMLAFSLDQVEELAYGALKYIVENGPDADFFDSSQERVLRINEYGEADGGAYPLANSPNSRDGARTTLNAFDEPHRLYMQRHLDAHTTMDANLPKRPLEDPWSLYVGTAGELGEGSVAEQLHTEAEMIRDGLIERPDLFYLYRTDNGGHDLTDKVQRIQAVAEATGPAGEWGPGQFDEIASKWDRPKADHAYLERVWLNRWVKSGTQAFDTKRWGELHLDAAGKERRAIPRGATVAVGFDGARFRDSTGIVITDLATGTQECFARWEKPESAEDEDPDTGGWEVPEAEVLQAFEDVFRRYRVVKWYADPPYWISEVGALAGKHPGVVEEWWTNRPRPMALAVRAYRDAMQTAAVGWSKASEGSRQAAFTRHVGNAGKQDTQLVDDEGNKLYILKKIHPSRKFDIAMAGCLSWQAYLDAIKKGHAPRRQQRPRQLRKGWAG